MLTCVGPSTVYHGENALRSRCHYIMLSAGLSHGSDRSCLSRSFLMFSTRSSPTLMWKLLLALPTRDMHVRRTVIPR